MIKRYTHKVAYEFKPILTLILYIMYGEHSLDVLIALLIAVEHIIINRYQRCLPVVGIYHIGLEVDIAQQFQHCTGEEYKSLGIVIKAVHTVSCEVIFVIQQIIGHSVLHTHENSAVLIAPCHGHGEIRYIVEPVFKFLPDAAIKRQYHTAVLAQCIECRRQRTCNVCKSSRCGIRQTLTCCIKYFHSITLLLNK